MELTDVARDMADAATLQQSWTRGNRGRCLEHAYNYLISIHHITSPHHIFYFHDDNAPEQPIDMRIKKDNKAKV